MFVWEITVIKVLYKKVMFQIMDFSEKLINARKYQNLFSYKFHEYVTNIFGGESPCKVYAQNVQVQSRGGGGWGLHLLILIHLPL